MRRMFKTIVVGTDGSATATQAVAKAAELARTCGSTVHVVSAFKPFESLYVMPEALPTSVQAMIDPAAEAKAVVDEAAERMRGDGVPTSTHTSPGDAASVLIEVAEAVEADLLVVGSQGMTGPARFLLGSVSNKVSHHAPCDLLIVRTTK